MKSNQINSLTWRYTTPALPVAIWYPAARAIACPSLAVITCRDLGVTDVTYAQKSFSKESGTPQK